MVDLWVESVPSMSRPSLSPDVCHVPKRVRFLTNDALGIPKKPLQQLVEPPPLDPQILALVTGRYTKTKDHRDWVKLSSQSPQKRLASPVLPSMVSGSFRVLTDDLLLRIIHFLPVSARFALRRVCRRLMYLSSSTITTLDLSDVTLPSSGILALSKVFTGLRELRLLECEHCTDVQLQYLAYGCGQLQHVSLNFCRNVTDVGIRHLAIGCKLLLSLDLTGCYYVGDAGITSIGQNSHLLESLCLRRCRDVTDQSLVALAAGCTMLKSLVLDRCKKITNEGVTALAKGCSQLHALDLTFCYRVSDAGIMAVLEHCAQLQLLCLDFCREITDSPFKEISDLPAANSIQTLSFKGCVQISHESLLSVAYFCPNLISLTASWGPLVSNSLEAQIREAKPDIEWLVVDPVPQELSPRGTPPVEEPLAMDASSAVLTNAPSFANDVLAVPLVTDDQHSPLIMNSSPNEFCTPPMHTTTVSHPRFDYSFFSASPTLEHSERLPRIVTRTPSPTRGPSPAVSSVPTSPVTRFSPERPPVSTTTTPRPFRFPSISRSPSPVHSSPEISYTQQTAPVELPPIREDSASSVERIPSPDAMSNIPPPTVVMTHAARPPLPKGRQARLDALEAEFCSLPPTSAASVPTTRSTRSRGGSRSQSPMSDSSRVTRSTRRSQPLADIALNYASGSDMDERT